MDDTKGQLDIRDYLRIVQKRKWLIIGVGLAAMLLGAVYAVSYPTSYRAYSIVLVQKKRPEIVWMARQQPAEAEMDIPLETQVSMVESTPLAKKVRQALQERNPENRLVVEVQEIKDALSASLLEPDRIRIVAESAFAERAVAIAREAATQFIDLKAEFTRQQDQRAREYLEDQLDRTEEELAALQNEIIDFQRTEGVYSEDAGAAEVNAGLSRYRSLKTELETERAAIREQIAQITKSLSGTTATGSEMATVPNPAFSSALAQLASARTALADLRSRYTEAHPAVRSMAARVESLKTQVEQIPGSTKVPIESLGPDANSLVAQRDALRNSQAQLQGRLEALERVIAQLESKAEELPAKQAQLYRLRSKANLLEAARSSILEELQNKRLAEQSKGAGAMVLDEPTMAEETKQSLPRVLLFTGMLGLVLGVALAMVFEVLDDTIHTPEELQRIADVRFLGLVPFVETELRELITVVAPKSPPAEAYRTLRSNLNFALLEKQANTILVTSAGSGEGKTATAANLAVVYAQADQNVIVTDTDLRRPALHRALHADSSRGLTNVLVGEANIEDVLQDTHVEGLRLVPTGPLPPNPAEMLASDAMKTFVQEVQQYADIVIFDSPPVLALTDAMLLASLVDQTILVAEAGQVTQQAFREALRTIENARGNLLGAVLNKLRLTATDYYYYYYYYYYYDYSRDSEGNRR